MLSDIKGQVAWVTGAGTGIGESAAIKLAEAGCKVILSGRRSDVLSKVSSKIGDDSSIQNDRPAPAIGKRWIDHPPLFDPRKERRHNLQTAIRSNFQR